MDEYKYYNRKSIEYKYKPAIIWFSDDKFWDQNVAKLFHLPL